MKYLSTPIALAGIGSNPKAERRRVVLDWRVAGISLAVALAYYLGAKIGFALTFQPHPVSVLWPPNSILLAALLLTPVRIWWVILLAAFPAHLEAHGGNLSAENTEDGARFCFRLPAAPRSESQEVA